MIRGAVIGYGGAFGMGRHHLEAMRGAGITPYAACDVDAERVASATEEFPGIRTFTDYHALLADPDVDLVVQILPHNMHGQVNLDIVRAGKHCVSEKPFTLTVAEADACIAAARESGVTLTVFHNRRFDGDHRAMMEVIARGEIGEVFHIEAGMGHFAEPGTWWRADKAVSGGNFFDWGVHFIDWVLHLIPDPIENVTAFYHKRRWSGVTNEDETEAVLRFRTGKYADVRISSLDAAPRPAFRILGTDGAIVAENIGSGVFTVHHYADGKMWRREETYSNRFADAGTMWYENLAAHLRDGAPLAITAESARRNIAVLEAAERSAASHQSEPVDGD
jgi:predicted dehydrogenase